MASSIFNNLSQQNQSQIRISPYQQNIAALKNNPQLQSIRNLIGNRNARDVFYEECSKRGVNPNDIISMLK